MSINQVLATAFACLADPSVGLGARVTALSMTADSPPRIRSDFNFVKWKLAGVMQPARTPNVMLRPVSWAPGLERDGLRDALAVVQVGVEFFDADTTILQDNVAVAATGLAQVMDGLRDYSDAHNGSVVDVLDRIDFQFGDFTGPASSGFTATIQIEERSHQ